MNLQIDPATIISQNSEWLYYDRLHREKYRDENQSHIDHCRTLANNLSSDESHGLRLYSALSGHRFLPAGRIQAALGATEREVSPFNCAVSQTIEDSMDSIMESATRAAKILRLGTGIGFNFSHLRPCGALIKKLKTKSSGPVSFMKIFDAVGSTIASSGHRRGAMMGILNVDHPDIETFVDAKMEKGVFRQFNLSVGISDAFMAAVDKDAQWPLQFGGEIYKTVSARALWRKIMHNAYISAEPGVIFLDAINRNNNLYYCETIEATNPCAEQPLPPNGLCLLGSFNLPKYIVRDAYDRPHFDTATLGRDIYDMVEAYDNIFDDAVYAIPAHREEAISKRRMGLGYTGIANAIEFVVGRPCYGEPVFCDILRKMAAFLCNTAYEASTTLAAKRGPFLLCNKEAYLNGKFIRSLPAHTRNLIAQHGIRNSHLISYAPCGTISQVAGNVSSGVEPIFYHSVSRQVHMKDGLENVTLSDFNYRHFGFKGKTLETCSIDEHLAVAESVQPYTDSAISKTVNVASTCSYDEYESIYRKAHKLGLKGLTVYRPSEIRGCVISEACSISGECKAA